MINIYVELEGIGDYFIDNKEVLSDGHEVIIAENTDDGIEITACYEDDVPVVSVYEYGDLVDFLYITEDEDLYEEVKFIYEMYLRPARPDDYYGCTYNDSEEREESIDAALDNFIEIAAREEVSYPRSVIDEIKEAFLDILEQYDIQVFRPEYQTDEEGAIYYA